MAVLEPNSEGSSVPREVVQNLEADDDYNKYTPSADCNSIPGWNIFRTKKLTKKRHESKSRRTERQGQETSNVCCSDEDYPQTARHVEPPVRSIPTMMMTINKTIQKMTLKDGKMEMEEQAPASSGCCSTGNPVGRESAETESIVAPAGGGVNCGGNINIAEPESGAAGSGVGDSTMSFEVENDEDVSSSHHHHPQLQLGHCSRNNNSSCSLTHPQGKRRRHRRKQQYKRMAVDVQNDKRSLQLKVPTSNSSEDSGIGKRKRNIILSGNKNVGKTDMKGGATAGPSNCFATTSQQGQSYQQQFWQLEPDNDAVMMEYDDLEASNYAQEVATAESIFVTEEESGESDTQNDDVESFSDHNQDADDEESDYYNNDSSTTSLSESSFTILNPSKKFIPVHSREIRSGRRRLKNSNISSIENEELSRFLQSPLESVLKLCPLSEKERQDFKNIASLYSLSYEEGCDPEDQRVWVQFTKTVKTTTQQQRRNEIIKAASTDRSSFSNFSEGTSLAPLFDKLITEKEGENSDEFIDEMHGSTNGNTMNRGGLGVSQLINSKRIKKGC